MSKHEKTGWLSCALFVSLWLLLGHTIMALLPGPNVDSARTIFALMAIYATGAYLLVLSWRAAYLAGRKRS